VGNDQSQPKQLAALPSAGAAVKIRSTLISETRRKAQKPEAPRLTSLPNSRFIFIAADTLIPAAINATQLKEAVKRMAFNVDGAARNIECRIALTEIGRGFSN
jgi:hypothetical protein